MLCPKISTTWKKLAPTGRHGLHVFVTLQVVLANEVEGEHKPDVSINISSSDLAGVLKVGREQNRTTFDQRFSSN